MTERRRPSLQDEFATSAMLDQNVAGYVWRILILLLIVAMAAIGVIAMQLLCVVFAGLLFGIFLLRLSQIIERRTQLPYRFSLAAVLASMLAVAVGLGVLLAPRLGKQLQGLSAKLSSSVNDLLNRANEWGWVDNITDGAPLIGGQLLGNFDAAAILGGVFSSLATAATALFLVLFIGVFLAVDPGSYRRGFLLLIPPNHRQRASQVLEASIDTLWWWTLGRLFAMTVVGISTSIGLWFLGVPMAFTLGTIAGLISFVPTIGAVLAILPALLLAMQQGWPTMAYVLILYACIQGVENNLLTPIVQQKAVSVPPIILVISQVLMGVLVGIMGIVIATPLAALVIELVRELYVKEDVAIQHSDG